MRTRRSLRSFTLLAAVLPAFVFAGSASADTLVGLTADNQLIQFDSATPGSPSPATPITGLAGGESIVGIDFRPTSGRLYAVGTSNRLYTVDPATGVANPVGAPGMFALNGTSFGIDFDPVADRLRVVSDTNQNLSLNPDDGTIAGPSTNLAFAPSDPNAGHDPNVVGSAHTTNVAGATLTTLYGIDVNLDVLVRQNPGTGELTTVGSLGVNPGSFLGFDVAGDMVAKAYFVAGFPFGSFFHTIDLTTGAAASAGDIPVPNLNGLAVVGPPRYSVPTLVGCPPAATPRNLIVLTSGNDITTGTALSDLIFAGTGNDIVDGLAGDDCIDLGTGADRGRGGSGNDFLPGGSGNDRLLGDSGNDRLNGQGGGDRISGGRGRDLLIGGSGRDRISGGGSADRISGGSGNDRIAGGGSADRISGGSGNDKIGGGTGRDRISAGPGNDRISTRGGGRDRINCGGGVDRVLADSLDRVSRSCE
jgi:Ca2+-binding RTX toxin-like protein